MPEKQGDAKRAPHTRPADRQRPHSTSHRRRAERHFRSGASEVQTRVLRARVDARDPQHKAFAGGVPARAPRVIYTAIENLTQDGRDRSLDYKLSSFNIAKGSWEARVIDEIAPQEDEIALPKTSSSVFNSTNLDDLLAQYRHRGCVRHRLLDRPVHRPCGQGRRGSRLLHDLRARFMHRRNGGTPRRGAAMLQGLLPAAHDR